MPQTVGAGLELQVSNSAQVSHMDSKNLTARAIIAASQGLHWKEMEPNKLM